MNIWKVQVDYINKGMDQNIEINSDINNKRTVQVAAPKEKENKQPENFIENQVIHINIRNKHSPQIWFKMLVTNSQKVGMKNVYVAWSNII